MYTRTTNDTLSELTSEKGLASSLSQNADRVPAKGRVKVEEPSSSSHSYKMYSNVHFVSVCSNSDDLDLELTFWLTVDMCRPVEISTGYNLHRCKRECVCVCV